MTPVTGRRRGRPPLPEPRQATNLTLPLDVREWLEQRTGGMSAAVTELARAQMAREKRKA